VRLKTLTDRLRRSGVSPDEFVFVVTYGRSGSTLTQGLLNTLPRTLVRGENDLYLLHHYRAWAGVRQFQQSFAEAGSRRGPKSAFYGIDEVELGRFISSAHDLAVTQMLGDTPPSEVDRIGFKEVLWHRIEAEETVDFFNWFEKVFPGARYVLNRRDHEKVAVSGFWQKQERDEVRRAIQRVEEIQDYLVATRPDRSLLTQYERVTSDDSGVSDNELRTLAEFVAGSCSSDQLALMRRTLGEGHGPRPFGRSRKPGKTAAER
jgi:hypothetical protein